MFKTLPDVFKHAAEKYTDCPSFLTRPTSGQPFQGPTWSELYQMGLDLATALAEMGINAKDHVAVLADNRFEWILTDYAILMNGSVSVPRATSIMDEELKYIVNHSESRVVVVEHEKMLKRLVALKADLPSVQHIIVMDKKFTSNDDGQSIYDLVAQGRKCRDQGNQQVEERISQIDEQDVFTIIYTSGTTGAPKGVLLTHANMIYMINMTSKIMDMRSDDRAVTILPIWHVFERANEYVFIAAGAATYYSNIRALAKDLQEVQPTLMGSAPRLWESIYDKVVAKVSSGSAVAKSLFKIALYATGQVKYAQRFYAGVLPEISKPSALVTGLNCVKYMVLWLIWIVPAKLLGFIPKKLQMSTGGKLRASLSAGGALPHHIDLFFNNIGISLLEGYGMTECCPAIAMRKPDFNVPGSVGLPLPGCEVEIRDLNNPSQKVAQGQNGIIHVKGPQVMKGYYKNPEATEKVLKAGWMDTGDIGVINTNNSITITGRSKETIVLLSGENVEPVPIENTLLESKYIAQTMLVGQDQKHLGALIVIDEENVLNWAKQNQITAIEIPQLLKSDQVNELIKSEIQTKVSKKNGFQPFEKIVNFRFIEKPFEVDDELTKLFKIKRHVVAEKYQAIIASMY